uniref:DUF637 domain-containing protein n=1 Tax=Pseudomonas pseudonitroreducens TaxID=2892326 RepID=UPI0023EEECEB
HAKSDSDLAWTSSKGEGKTDETLRQTQMIAQGNIAIKAVDGLRIDYKHIDQKSVSQAIDAMVQADPGLAWIKEAEARGDVDWRAVKEIHDSYSYSHSGMGPATQLAVAIAAAAIGGWAAAGALSSAGVAGGTFAMGAGVGAAGSLASTTAVNLINNKGNIGKTLSDSLTGDNLKQVAIASLVGGATTGYFDQFLETKTNPVTGKVTVELSTVSGASRFAANQAAQNITSAALSKTLGQGGSFGDALKDSVYNTFAAAGFNAIGDFGVKNGLSSGDAQMVVMHAVMGGLAAQARGDSFAAGAAGAGLNEALVAGLDKLVSVYSPETRDAMLTMSAQLVGLIGAVAQDGNASVSQLETGAWAAKNSTQYNYLLHEEIQERAKEIKGCGGKDDCEQDVIKRYAALDKARNDDLPGLCETNPNQCVAVMKQLAAERGLNEAAIDSLRFENVNAAVGIYLAAESNEGAIDTIQLELLRNKYGDGAVVAAQLLQMAAAGSLARNAKAGTTKGTASVQNLTERGTLVNLRPNDVAVAQRPVRTLVQDEAGRYWLQSPAGNRITPSGSYDFVTMPDGSIRVSRPNVNQDFSTHLGLSGGGEVKYAGSIRFGNNDGPNRGVITQWSNNSGHYQPPATLNGNAGLPVNLFNPK